MNYYFLKQISVSKSLFCGGKIFPYFMLKTTFEFIDQFLLYNDISNISQIV